MRMFIGLDIPEDYRQEAVLDVRANLVKEQRIANSEDELVEI